MNTKKLLEFISHKTWLWQRVFRNFYVGIHQLEDVIAKTDLQISTIIRLCRNVDDLNDLWDLAETLDSYEDEILGTIQDIRFCKPIPWQYDFLQFILENTEMPIEKTLDLETIADAYCAALMVKDLDTAKLFADLDKTYDELYASTAHKEILLRRNLSLVLENSFSRRFGDDISKLNSRELVDYYLPRCGIKGLTQALKTARTDDIKLTPEERACLGYSYYSPFFCDAIELRQQIPGSTVFACVEDQLKNEQEYRQNLQAHLRRTEDEDEEDALDDELERQHHFLFVDPLDRCLMDFRLGDVVYANVYVQKFTGDDLNNSLPDFIRLHKGLLYTVEFVDDFSAVEAAQDFLKYFNAVKMAIMQLEKLCAANPLMSWQPTIRMQHQKLEKELSQCYYLACKM